MSLEEAFAKVSKLSPFAQNVLMCGFDFPNYVNNRLGETFEWSEFVFPTPSQITKEEAEILYWFRGDHYDWNCATLLNLPQGFFKNITELKESLELFKSVGSKAAAELLVKICKP